MTFGQPSDFAIEAYLESSGLEWAGFGRMSVVIQGIHLGELKEEHCSLHDAVDRLRTASLIAEALWDESFEGLSDLERFDLLNNALYLGDIPDEGRYGRFDFLTNSGEQFDDSKTFVVCRPEGQVHILYQFRDGVTGSGQCRIETFRGVVGAFVAWFDQQVPPATLPG